MTTSEQLVRERVLLLYPGDIDRQPHRPPAPVARGGHPLPPQPPHPASVSSSTSVVPASLRLPSGREEGVALLPASARCMFASVKSGEKPISTSISRSRARPYPSRCRCRSCWGRCAA
eukprot:scaffold42615_cov42-Phaeocystis_antarctica.AAC.1